MPSSFSVRRARSSFTGSANPQTFVLLVVCGCPGPVQLVPRTQECECGAASTAWTRGQGALSIIVFGLDGTHCLGADIVSVAEK